MRAPQMVFFGLALLLAASGTHAERGAGGESLTALSRERLVFQTEWGDIHMAFYPNVAPKTVDHIRRCGELGLYNTNHFFRVDRGFVAQTADINGGRTAPMSEAQRAVADLNVPFEVHADVKHSKRGILSMARGDDPGSGGSSFSILLGPAPHLDMNYAVFGEVTEGLETLSKFEELPTRTEGIFVMPTQRITILSTYTYVIDDTPAARPGQTAGDGQKLCSEALAEVQARYDAQAAALERIRAERLPGR
ncbi:peptidyl-prolyl cis-trans isomerase CYP23 [Micractinium conductrix]|uniref:Peptidyl-prolyl cis-trans isomerase n=1 Tax=Micractinium conductrix TaxID=554055 RepID=A0A2P6V1P3_9CHLO|nr:peptidyl-prolyl cis-trans isomerase CYP23 [Micractinium conductrix]|eukprot:PSC68000.1 peptidyl-prolyl cis-trans isomerase CYP23 [Micractinium conductrix]